LGIELNPDYVRLAEQRLGLGANSAQADEGEHAPPNARVIPDAQAA